VVSYEDYVRLEAEGPTRHEYLDGEILAIACGTPEHAALAMAIGRQLGNQLEGRTCRVFSSDLRVRVLATGLTTYPDVTVICGPSERDPENSATVVNPTVVVEVTSDSSEVYDRGAKHEHYRSIPSLAAIVVVSHRETLVEVSTRSASGWNHTEFRAGDRATIAAIGVELDVAALYAAAEEPGS